GPYSFLWSPSEGLNNPEAPNPVAEPSRTTQYILTVTDALGCEGKDSLTIRVHPGIEANAGGTLITCALSPTTLDLTVQGGAPPFRYRWSPASGLNNPAVQRPVLILRNDAIYVVNVTDANGCSVSDTLYVTVHAPPVVDAGDGLSLCAGSADKLRGRVSGGKPPYTYEWTPREGLSSATILTPEVRPERSTVYVLSVRDGNGCVVRDSVPVIVHPQPILQMDSEAMACAAQGVQIGAIATDGTPPYRYAWTPVAGLSGTSVAMPFASPARNTTYTVTVTDANGCTVGASVRVTVQPRPELRYKDRHQICAGTSVELAGSVRGGSPPFVFEWTPETGLNDAGIARPVASPSTTTTYTVRIADALGCTDEQQIDVEIIARPVVNAGEDVVLCEGVPVALNGSVSGGRAPYTVLWEPATGLSSVRELSPTVRTSTSRVYTLTITDANGCQASDEMTVTVAPSPRAQAGDDIRICAGAGRPIGAPATGGTPPYRYQWTPGFGLDDPSAMRPAASPNQTTEYTVTVTDARGCTAKDAVSVFVYPKPEISLAREMTICRDQGRVIELKVTGGSGPYRYDWMPREGLSDGSIANPIANPIQTTTYTVTVRDENGCRITATITVTVLPCNKADAGRDQELCAGDDVRLGPTVADTSHGAAYSWSPTKGLTSPHSAITRAQPGNTATYILAVRNRYDCISTDTVTVTVHAPPVVDAGEDMRLCSRAEATVRVSVRDGQPPYRYQWEPSSGVEFPRAASTVVRPSRTTTYRVTVTDAQGCTAVDSLHIHVSDPLRIALEASLTVCEAQPVRIGGDITGGTPPYSVFWSPASGIDDRNNSSPLLTPSGDLLYSVTITDAEGCQHIDSVRVRMLPAPRIALTVDGDSDLCKGERVRLVATPGYISYAWSTVEKGRLAPEGVRDEGDERSSGGPSDITVSEAGEYMVTVTDRNKCAATSEAVRVRVFEAPDPHITALGPLMFCEGDSVVLDAGKGYASYLWSNGATGRYLTVNTSGSFAVTVTGENGCEGNATSVATHTRPVPVAKLRRQRDTLIAEEAPRYQWLRDGRVLRSADARILVVDRGGRYQVRTSNEAGCEVLSEPVELRFASATVSLPRMNVRVGDTIDISLRLSNPQGLKTAQNETVSAVLALKKKTLDVISGGTILSEGAEAQRIRIDGRHEDGNTTLATLRAIVHDGRGRVPLKLERVEWSQALVRVTTRDGWLQIAP
ncbi:MAG: hypothetical protein KFH87_07940, partial [Bacteroidetes bacterium]|nr:hypothetical protein [Bacteroidota bacterium]